jgi:hypothetical protein
VSARAASPLVGAHKPAKFDEKMISIAQVSF